MLNFLNVIKIFKENVLDNHLIPKMIISSIAGWSTAYVFIRKITGQEPEWAVRLVTIVHATVVSTLAFFNWAITGQWGIEIGHSNSKFEEVILCLSLGYFFFDIMWIIKYQTEGPLMFFHHLATVLFLSVILAKGISATEVVAGLSALELTNPCLQARWFLRTYGFRDTIIYVIIELVFMSCFIIVRIFFGTYIAYGIVTHPKSHIFLKIGTVTFNIVSWVFAYQMISYVSKRGLKSKEIKKD